jgi:hypothetical protein
MTHALLLYLFFILAGVVSTYLFDRAQGHFLTRLAGGTAIGLALLASLGFLWALLWGSIAKGIILAFVPAVCALTVLIQADIRRSIASDLIATFESCRDLVRRPWTFAFGLLPFGILVAFLAIVFGRVLFESQDGLYTGFTNNLGDLPFHLQVTNSFAKGNNFPPEDPVFAGVHLTYPFMADFLSAIFLSSGYSLRTSLFVPNMLLMLSFVILLGRWTVELTDNRLAGFLAPLLVIFSGGLGWVMLINEAPHKTGPAFHYLLNLPHDFTILSGHTWRWGNSLTTLLVPQRSMLFGLPIAVLVFRQWWIAQRDFLSSPEDASASSHPAVRRQIAAGILCGLLPLIHAHIFLGVVGVAAGAAVLSRCWRLWFAFFVSAALTASPELLWLIRGIGNRAHVFVSLHMGWDHGEINPVWFWFLNTGLFIPLLIAALAWRVGSEPLISRRVAIYYAPFTLCFLAPNLIKLAPWEWDNIKVLFLWFAASTPIVAHLLAHCWQLRHGARALAVGVLCTLTLAGGLDLSRVVLHTVQLRLFDNDGIAIAKEIASHTAPRALILHAPTYDSPVFLTGRRSLMGYSGQLWSRGLDSGSREGDIRNIYAGAPNSQALLKRYALDYVVIGPQERAMMLVNTRFFSNFTLIGQCGGYSLYKIHER